MDRKRRHEEIEHLEELTSAAVNTNVHGAVTKISPVKKRRNSIFFDGMLADDSSKMHVVGFDALQQKKLKTFHDKQIPVQLVNIKVKESRYGDGHEILLKSEIKESSRRIDVPGLLAGSEPESNEINLDQLSTTDIFKKVTMNIKAIEVKEPVLTREKMKQDIIIADKTATGKVTLWEEHINELDVGKSYTLKSFVVRVFQSTKYLARGDTSEILSINDIGVVATPRDEDADELVILNNAIVIGVPQLDIYKECFKCTARVEPLTPPFGRCSKGDCKMLQRFDMCTVHTVGKLLLMYKSDDQDGQNKVIQVHVSGDHLRQIAPESSEHLTPEALLKAGELKSVTISKDKKTIQAIKTGQAINK